MRLRGEISMFFPHKFLLARSSIQFIFLGVFTHLLASILTLYFPGEFTPWLLIPLVCEFPSAIYYTDGEFNMQFLLPLVCESPLRLSHLDDESYPAS
jgi:membrane-bound metal-dependent hydrolase YbcI (DUF457 family)